jgi:hypothetical protein
MPDSCNDINVLDRSNLFEDVVKGKAPAVNFQVNGNTYRHGYLLADGIYPRWATIVKTIPNPVGNKQKLFAKVQEAVRKDVERAFGVLQARYYIIERPCRLWNHNAMEVSLWPALFFTT